MRKHWRTFSFVKRLALLFCLLLVSGGCAQPPLTELASARDALAQAYASGAARLAPADYEVAARALKDSETLVHDGDYQEARRLLPFAALRARRALVLARSADEKLRREEMARRQRALAEARRKQAESMAKPPPPAPPQPAPVKPPPPPLTHYTVSAGETLWTIAAQPRVYDDPLLWPLLYKANRDQIRDPRQIYAGQVLNIPRDLAPADLDEARETARSSDIFPVGKLLPGSATPAP